MVKLKSSAWRKNDVYFCKHYYGFYADMHAIMQVYQVSDIWYLSLLNRNVKMSKVVLIIWPKPGIQFWAKAKQDQLSSIIFSNQTK